MTQLAHGTNITTARRSHAWGCSGNVTCASRPRRTSRTLGRRDWYRRLRIFCRGHGCGHASKVSGASGAHVDHEINCCLTKQLHMVIIQFVNTLRTIGPIIEESKLAISTSSCCAVVATRVRGAHMIDNTPQIQASKTRIFHVRALMSGGAST